MIAINLTGETLDQLCTGNLTIDGVTAEAVAGWMREQGYYCEIPHEWELIQEFCARVGCHRNTFSRAINDPRCPRVDLQRGPSGRVIHVASNKLFEAFVLHRKQALAAATAQRTALAA